MNSVQVHFIFFSKRKQRHFILKYLEKKIIDSSPIFTYVFHILDISKNILISCQINVYKQFRYF